MKYGLLERDLSYIKKGIEKFSEIEEVTLFGSRAMGNFKKASDVIGVNFDKITIISDDLYGDILPAMKLGMEGVLVLSGKIKSEKEIRAKPHKIFKNIGEYLGFIKAKRGN